MSTKNDVVKKDIVKKEKRPFNRKFAIIALIVLVAGAVSAFILMRSKQSFGAGKGVIFSREVIPGKEIVIGVNNATLYIPGDASALKGVISITSRAPNSFSPVGDAVWQRPQVVVVEYRDEKDKIYPHVKFPKPLLICFKVTEERWQDYSQRPDNYQVQYYDEEQSPAGWVELPLSARDAKHQLCGQTDHLSTFALAIRNQTGIPVTGGDTTPTPTGLHFPTSIPPGGPHQGGIVATPVSTQAALTATSVALTATDVPPTDVPPTDVPPTNVPPTNVPPTVAPTDVPTDVPTVAPTDVPTDPPPTDPPPTDPPPTDPPPTDPPPTDPPPTDPPAATQPPVVP